MRRTAYFFSNSTLPLKLDSVKKFFSGKFSRQTIEDSKASEYVPEETEEEIKTSNSENSSTGSKERERLLQACEQATAGIKSSLSSQALLVHFSQIFDVLGAHQVLTSRSLSYLVYPDHNRLAVCAERNVREFALNVGRLAELVAAGDTAIIASAGEQTENGEVSTNSSDGIVIATRILAAAATVGAECREYEHAVRAADAAIGQARDPSRKGALYAIKAGVLNKAGRYEDANQAASEAVQLASSLQGYVQGVVALRALRKWSAEKKLLLEALSKYPDNDYLKEMLQKNENK